LNCSLQLESSEAAKELIAQIYLVKKPVLQINPTVMTNS
jgi:hypothetical protein